MSVPMILTWGRIALAPLFFLLYQLAGNGSLLLLLTVWAAFAIIEVSDLLDGYLARKLRQESELGKVLDPFADAMSRLTYFIAFAGSGILPLWILLILVYRDIGVAYIRVMVSKSNVLMPARASGKLKAWAYAVAGIGGLAIYSARLIDWMKPSLGALEWIAFGLFLIAGGVALWSLVDYSVFFLKYLRKTS
jgi:CDP-diacylglycerol--glycerol-3-phosphate 3-phosphatidyltransferase